MEEKEIFREESMDGLTRQEYLAELMNRTDHFIHRNFYARNGQGRVLRILDREDSMTQQDLQNRLDIQSSSISEILTKLETSGFIIRERDESDRRRCIITITDAGREDLKKHEISKRKRMSTLFDGLDENEQDELIRILTKLHQSWRKMKEKEGGQSCI